MATVTRTISTFGAYESGRVDIQYNDVNMTALRIDVTNATGFVARVRAQHHATGDLFPAAGPLVCPPVPAPQPTTAPIPPGLYGMTFDPVRGRVDGFDWMVELATTPA